MGLLVLNVDHLPTHLLGPYGNTSVPTPTLNRWAANGIVVDGAFKSGCNHQRLLDACLPTSNSSSPFTPRPTTAFDLCFTPAQTGHPTWFEPASRPHPVRNSPRADAPAPSPLPASTTVQIQQSISQRVANSWEATSLAHYVAQVFEHLAKSSLQPEHAIWLNLPLLSSVWDAPLEWRNFLANDEDLETYRGWQSPHIQRTGDVCSGFDETHGFDPDQRLAYEHAAGAMVILLDHACEWLESALANLTHGQAMAILLTAESGFSLGEHFSIGGFPTRLWVEESHVPILLRTQFPNQYPARIAGIQDQHKVLQFWCEKFAPPSDSSSTGNPALTYESLVIQSLQQFGAVDYSIFSSQQRSAVLSYSSDGVVCRTVNWSFLWQLGHAPRLFVRPDDRAEQNDVATRCRDVVATFLWHLPDIAHALGQLPDQLPQLQNDEWSTACRVLESDGLSPTTMSWAQHLDDIQCGRFTPLDQLPETLWQNRA